MWFNPEQHKSAQLDHVTSKAIRYKGVVSGAKQTLDWIDPWLIERNVGVTNLQFQKEIKRLFDPDDLLMKNKVNSMLYS